MTALRRLWRTLRSENFRSICVDWTQIFGNLCVPISILVAILVFAAQRHDQQAQQDAQVEAQKTQDRRAAAMQFVMLKYQDEFLKPAAKISAAFTEPDVILLLKNLRGSDRQEILKEQTDKAGLDSFAVMADLYRAVVACREAQSCDAAILDTAYRTEITQFYCLSREQALPDLAKKLNDPEYGTPLARYAQGCGG